MLKKFRNKLSGILLRLFVCYTLAHAGPRRLRPARVGRRRRETGVASGDLSQSEADFLLALAKRRVDRKVQNYPGLGGGLSIPLASLDGKEQFILDLRRSRVNLAKGSYQNRARRVIVLTRLCFGGAAHPNPDGQEVGSPHIHLYRENYGDKWAYPLPVENFPQRGGQWETFQDFLRFCNITEPPDIRRGLSL